MKNGHEILGLAALFAGIVLCFIANNAIVSANWKCENCGGALPKNLGRSSLRPKLVDTCPECGKVWN